MELSITKIDDIFNAALQDPSDKLLEIKKQWDIALKAGLKGQLERLRRWAIAIKLEEFNFKLLKVKNSINLLAISMPLMCRIDYVSTKNGELLKFKNEKNRDILMWDKIELSRFRGNIPKEIFEQIPENAGDKAYVFEARVDTDPIIAVKASKNEYIAIWKWD